MKKIIINLSSILLVIISMTGCAPTLPPEVPIIRQSHVDNVNHNLSKDKFKEIKINFLAYRNNIVMMDIDVIFNIIDKIKHEKNYKDVQLSKENLYECTIKTVRGDPEPYFDKMFFIEGSKQDFKEFFIGLNYNDVNDVRYYNNGSFYVLSGGTALFIYVEMSGLTVKSTLDYKCKLITNSIFKD